jgi:hypothetical protein
VEKKEAILRFNLCDNIICNSNKNKLCVENVFREREADATREPKVPRSSIEASAGDDDKGKNGFRLKQQRGSRILLFHLRGSGVEVTRQKRGRRASGKKSPPVLEQKTIGDGA